MGMLRLEFGLQHLQPVESTRTSACVVQLTAFAFMLRPSSSKMASSFSALDKVVGSSQSLDLSTFL